MEGEVPGLYKLNTDGEDGSDDAPPIGVLTLSSISLFASIKIDLACNIQFTILTHLVHSTILIQTNY
jgi:hypothetical protein